MNISNIDGFAPGRNTAVPLITSYNGVPLPKMGKPSSKAYVEKVKIDREIAKPAPLPDPRTLAPGINLTPTPLHQTTPALPSVQAMIANELKAYADYVRGEDEFKRQQEAYNRINASPLAQIGDIAKDAYNLNVLGLKAKELQMLEDYGYHNAPAGTPAHEHYHKRRAELMGSQHSMLASAVQDAIHTAIKGGFAKESDKAIADRHHTNHTEGRIQDDVRTVFSLVGSAIRPTGEAAPTPDPTTVAAFQAVREADRLAKAEEERRKRQERENKRLELAQKLQEELQSQFFTLEGRPVNLASAGINILKRVRKTIGSGGAAGGAAQ